MKRPPGAPDPTPKQRELFEAALEACLGFPENTNDRGHLLGAVTAAGEFVGSLGSFDQTAFPPGTVRRFEAVMAEINVGRIAEGQDIARQIQREFEEYTA
ncbi:MAG: hypothetical protein AAF389_14810 [Gemmatimonadota bacterium]